ncbi:MAG: hypothetical protein RIC35_05955 [Marinoscillum sp.]
MKRKFSYTILFLVGIVGLRQSIVVTRKLSPTLSDQTKMINERNIDPAVIFYTESNEALRAEKEVRKKVN